MQIDLTREQTEALRGALTSYLSELRMEIGATDNRGFRDALKQERSTLESIARMLGSAELRSA
jgi:uncharacterized protein (DUF2164 family)